MRDNWFKVGILAIFAVMFFGVICALIEYANSKDEPLKPHEGYQRTLEYIGFDGKKHQAIVIHTAQHNWVLVEKR
jgi:hypothetical protein